MSVFSGGDGAARVAGEAAANETDPGHNGGKSSVTSCSLERHLDLADKSDARVKLARLKLVEVKEEALYELR